MTEIQKLLDEPIPREVISTRSGGGSKQLSYLETWYVIDRLNQVVGSMNWSNEIKELTLLPGDGRPAYRAIVSLEVMSDERNQRVIKEGVGYGSDKSDFNSHELAMKEAVSDAFKVAAKNLGRSMGLALYDKTQEFISDAPANATAKVANNSNGNAANTKDTSSTPTTSTADPRAMIRSAYSVLLAKRKVTKEEFAEKYLKNKSSKDLTDDEAKASLIRISLDFSELKL